MELVLWHCRENHKDFYRRMWFNEIVPSGQAGKFYNFAPLD
jgi:hypothetical protein